MPIILDIKSIYTKYFNLANKANKQYNKIYTLVLGLEKDFYISNDKREQSVIFFQE